MTTTEPRTITDDPEHTTEYVRAWRVASKRHAHLRYVVTYDRLENEWRCQCTGNFYRGTCWHVDQAIKALTAEWRQAKHDTRGAA